MTERDMRLPGFSDFSPGIIGDIRRPLEIVCESSADPASATQLFADAFFSGVVNKRSRTNVRVSLGPGGFGLVDLRTWRLTELGQEVLNAPDGKAAARIACADVLKNRNGEKLIDAVRNLDARGFTGGWKSELKLELERLGVTDLAAGTTDHTTLANWMVEAEILVKSGRSGYRVNDPVLKDVLGVTGEERGELLSLTAVQLAAVRHVRIAVELSPGASIRGSELLAELVRDFGGLVRDDQFSAQVLAPLETLGYFELQARSSGRGSKSGNVSATRKLIEIPLDALMEDFEDAVPPDLRMRLNTPGPEIQRLLRSSSKNDRGLGLELLALRMLLDLGLEPRGFRVRSSRTAYAEVDLIAEGASLVFSRWTLQCKHNATHKVGVGDVAKEVGIAVHQKAHVVCVISTTGFSKDVYDFAKGVAESTPLQFVLVPGTVVDEYLATGRACLIEFVLNNAGDTMRRKRVQSPLPTS